jgi:glycosyltransferase involved in cell wall biosynthesis
LSDTPGPRILAIGRLDAQKGFDVLLNAFAVVRRHYPWRLVLVGDGPEREALHALARRSGLDDAVEWIGAIRNPFPYYRWADLVVMPSRFEGFPNVALEAMSCGKPVICANCKTGPREVTQNGRYGMLVKVNDVDSLAEAILTLGADAERRVQLGRLAQNHVRATYDVSCTKPLYASVLCLNP